MKIDAVKKIVSREKTIEQKLTTLGARRIRARLPRLEQELLSPAKRALLRFGLILPADWKRSSRIFLVGGTIVLLLFSGLQLVEQGQRLTKRILGEATTAYDYLNSGRTSLLRDDFEKARGELELAEKSFAAAREELPLKSTPLGGQADTLLALGEHSARAMQKLTQALTFFEDSRLKWDSATNSSDQGLYFSLKASREKLQESLREIEAARGLMSRVDRTLLPGTAAQKFDQAGLELAAGQRAIETITDLEAFGLAVIGGELKTYLLIFQNNNEARATGGFIGTYGIVRFENGRVFLEKIESIYDLDGQLQERIAAPGPMQRELTKYWGIRDANWFADFPSSSREILELFTRETGRTADGILSFTPDVFERLLVLTGPIAMPDYGLTLTADNFRSFAQYKTSVDYDRVENRPKKFLADFAPLFLERVQSLDRRQWLSLIGTLSELIAQKHILMYSADDGLESRIKNYHLGGEVLQTDGDYLSIINSNVGGGKTDLAIKQQVVREVEINEDGEATVYLTITRTQEGYDEKELPRNLNFMRVLVPRGSTLLSSSGAEDYPILPSSQAGASTDPDLAAWDSVPEESGYTEFRFWQVLMPGESKIIDLIYRLPSRVDGKYTLLLQKQSGAPAFHFRLEVKFPREVVYSYPDDFSGMIDRDRLYGVVGR